MHGPCCVLGGFDRFYKCSQGVEGSDHVIYNGSLLGYDLREGNVLPVVRPVRGSSEQTTYGSSSVSLSPGHLKP